MTLGALLDLGFPREKLLEELAKLGLENYTLEIFQGSRKGISAAGLEVKVGPREEHHRHFSDIRKIIEDSSLDLGVKKMSLAVFQRLAEAEAKVHNQPVAEVHFHEVGAVDSIVDIVGTAIGVDFFKPDRILASELPMGRGFIQCQHGRLPLPAPATLEILKGYPIKSVEAEGELVTPTGAAIVAALSAGIRSWPSMKVEKIGYGMGKKDFPDHPNLLRLVLGEGTGAGEGDRVTVLESNIDDMNPQFYDYLMEKLFEQGALDVSLTSLLMKKNRPGTLLRVIVEEHRADGLAELILKESTTLGVRSYVVSRKKLFREVNEVQTKYGKIRVKVAGDLRFQPEYEDCKRIARQTGVPIQEVYLEAMRSKK